MKVTDIKKELFGPHTYTAQAFVTREMMSDSEIDLEKMVTHKLALDIAEKIVKTMTIYKNEDMAEGITTFMVRPVMMDSAKFNELLDKYILKVVESIGSEDKENTSRRNAGPFEHILHLGLKTHPNKD